MRERTGREKVAILLLALGEKLGTQLLQKFDSAEVKAIMNSAASLGRVDKHDLDHLVDDFAAHFAKALGIGTDFDAVRTLVERAFSPGELSRMLGSQVMQTGQSIWKKFEAGMENVLVPYLLDEHPQTIAYILSKLDSEFAARCLSMLPGDFRITVARRLLKVQAVDDSVAEIVEAVIDMTLLMKAESGLENDGRNRLATMLNRLDRETCATILAGVAAWKPEEAVKLKKLIFSFEDIGRLSQESRLTVFDKLQHDQIVVALKGMDPSLKETVLASLGARARRMVETELTADKGIKTKEGDLARSAIAAQVLEMAQRGDISLPDDDPTSL
ncbi:FliG C-terminal domain-containing protein [Aestuariivirga sp.]|jgi:flagellar motor switch protein FliG|uniref:FliG C-terminal domain-containing protein n=1 Tax=Aestuariivirga sp. TaxID=2650926 RepID=UPI00378529A4